MVPSGKQNNTIYLQLMFLVLSILKIHLHIYVLYKNTLQLYFWYIILAGMGRFPVSTSSDMPLSFMWAVAVWLSPELGKQVFKISEVCLQACRIQVLLERTGIMEDAMFPGKILLKPKLLKFKVFYFE